MGLILLSHHGLLLPTVPTILGQPPFQLNSKKTKFSLVLELDRYHLFGPFQFKLWVQCSSNYGCQGFFPLRNSTCFTVLTERYKASQKGEGREQIEFPFGSLNRRFTGTRPHSIHYPCFSI